MNAGPATALLAAFNENWRMLAPELVVMLNGHQVELRESHPLGGEIAAVCAGHDGSLPYFREAEAIWCTVAPDSDALRGIVAELQAWVLPSFGGELPSDGYIAPFEARGRLGTVILIVSPSGYYRWRCHRDQWRDVGAKLSLRRSLAERRPARQRPPRPSLYELRARFAATLLTGDRDSAEQVIEQIDELQLDSAVNTQFMRIRLWHHFHEYDQIRNYPNLARLLTQPLPVRVLDWINEARGVQTPPPTVDVETPTPSPAPVEPAAVDVELVVPDLPGWQGWFAALRRGDRATAEQFFSADRERSTDSLGPAALSALVAAIEEIYLDDALRERERDLIGRGMVELLEEFVRQEDFPRTSYGDLYLALLRVWCALYAGVAAGQEHGHILLELAHAALRLNREPNAVRGLLERWWDARPARNQLPYVLDAVELLEGEFPDPAASANLWLSAADTVRRAADTLLPSELALWRRTAQRIGIDEPTITEFIPALSQDAADVDILAESQLRHVAIVCMREAQAREAAEQVRARSGAEVSLVLDKVAGQATEHARHADMVLFVWMATSHAIFRAFDGFDRKRLCYVQGTGVSSIVRALERWVQTRG